MLVEQDAGLAGHSHENRRVGWRTVVLGRSAPPWHRRLTLAARGVAAPPLAGATSDQHYPLRRVWDDQWPRWRPPTREEAC